MSDSLMQHALDHADGVNGQAGLHYVALLDTLGIYGNGEGFDMSLHDLAQRIRGTIGVLALLVSVMSRGNHEFAKELSLELGAELPKMVASALDRKP